MLNHVPVLYNECLSSLNIRPEGVYVDATLGLGGHSEGIAGRLTSGKLLSIDRDQSAIDRARERLSKFNGRVLLIHGNFSEIGEVLRRENISSVDGILFDLGVSSPQLDNAERGFSYMKDAPLDMRMDQSSNVDARFIVNNWSEEKLLWILREYGEERHAARISAALVRAREGKEIKTTAELTEIIKSAMPAYALREKQHPAKRSFQAIRIAVNDELGSIGEALKIAPYCLAKGGRLAVISFHSLEDRIVKNSFQSLENGCTCPKESPVCTCGFNQILKRITKKPITPSAEELKENPRSRSAKLRVAERV